MLMTTFIIIAFIVCWCINRISILRIRKNADRIFENIIGNAVKYSADNLNVSLFDDGRVIFRNKAPDISPVAAGRLLDRFR